MAVNSASILTSVKSALGIEEDVTDFDSDIIIYINGAFSTLHQLAIGPENGFYIENATPTWAGFIEAVEHIQSVKTYVILQVKLLFDPPPTSFAIEAVKDQINELGWRLNIELESVRHPL